ncbi:MAG: hypothetical protein J6J43_05670 [Oscillospiraceae bacterium]|nr:hypothetical protein [Oscillospiraceae bacterium]
MMGNLDGFFSLIIMCYGIYSLYLWFTCRKGQISDNCMLVPRDETMAGCVDAEAYKAYILPRLLVFGALIAFFGLLGVIDAYTTLTEGLSIFLRLAVLIVVPFAVLIWFAVCLKRMHKKLWVL